MFEKAIPIWISNREKEMHLRVQFKSIFDYNGNGNIILRLATSGVFNFYVNGEFVAYGPARAGKGYFRIDEYEITNHLKKGKNIIIIEVCGYYTTSFSIQRYPSFLSAEVISDGNAILWTGEHFTARVNPHYIQKTQRYSYQRPMVEAYRVIPNDTYLNDFCSGDALLETATGGMFWERNIPYPEFEYIKATEIASGIVKFIVPKELHRDRSMTVIDEDITGYKLEELDVIVTDEAQCMDFLARETLLNGHLNSNTYSIFKLPYNATGMINLDVECHSGTTLYILFDEILSEGKVDCIRLEGANVIKFELPQGNHHLRLFEAYTMQYIKLVAVGGECIVSSIGLTEYKYPKINYDTTTFEPQIKKIADAAIETFRQNSVDLYMDCPSRERAGWLCDSFFTARTEFCLTNKSLIEKNFLENFLCEEEYEGLPKGMLPMCYPSDHLNGMFIPQWAMWLIIELDEFFKRTNDEELVNRYKNKVFGLLEFLKTFENSDGLLEHVQGWNFVEWSKANELINDVNYPTNMLYYATLRAAGGLYNEKGLFDKSQKIKATILKQSFNGEFFSDNAVRINGELSVSGESTEVCQYYAFFFGIADIKTHYKLWKIMRDEFGPDRDINTIYPQIYPANAFIGNYLRLDILMRFQEYDKAYKNILGYFGYMAEQTGTLWENMTSYASCNHGFASHVICWIDELNRKGYLTNITEE